MARAKSKAKEPSYKIKPASTIGTQHSQTLNVGAKQLTERKGHVRDMEQVSNGHRSTVTVPRKTLFYFLLQRPRCIDNVMNKGAIKIAHDFSAEVDG
jgi:hypothetical protein